MCTQVKNKEIILGKQFALQAKEMLKCLKKLRS
ncbi:hypothetical protein HNQ37_000511 [Lactovum miscens]|uniref:Uncharacterized protein n=1 Tax=Lactovum miscens TaxID=190387 RepID=A0A841C8B5_9LACT|nr:hypothetical protein [Lactovum miscens]